MLDRVLQTSREVVNELALRYTTSEDRLKAVERESEETQCDKGKNSY